MAAAGEQVNAAMEALIRCLPDQYLWSYNIHRRLIGEVTPDGETV
jgi:lauroyl/myristoyl acyltransferase